MPNDMSQLVKREHVVVLCRLMRSVYSVHRTENYLKKQASLQSYPVHRP